MVLRVIVILLLVGLPGAYAHRLATHQPERPATPELSRLPASFKEWSSRDYAVEKKVAQILAADVMLHRRYRHRNGSDVWVFVAYFATQAVNSQIHSPRHCVPGNGWRITSTEHTTLPLPSGSQPAARMLIERQGKGQEICYWFRTRGGALTGDYALKWDLMKNALGRKPTDAAFVRYNAALEDSVAMRDLITELDVPLRQMLGEIGLR